MEADRSALALLFTTRAFCIEMVVAGNARDDFAGLRDPEPLRI